MKKILNYINEGGVLFVALCIALVLNHRFGYITIIGIFSILVFCLVTLKTKIDKGSIIILLYTLFYITFSFVNGFTYSLSTLVLYAITPFIFYQYGGEIVKRYKKEEYVITAWLVVIICYCIDIFHITLENTILTGELIRTDRIFSFWDDESKNTSATSIGLPMSIGMIGLPMFIIAKNKLHKISFIIVFVLSIMTTLSLLNRTSIIVALLCLLIVVGYRYRSNIKILLLTLLLVSVIIITLMEINLISDDLINYYAERNENIGTMGDRSYRWREAIVNLFKHPLGWANNGEIYYVHNMWLDIARISGIIPFILLVYMTYDSFKTAFMLIKYYKSTIAYMMLGLNVCFFASCFGEPIYGGTHFMLYCMLWGTENVLKKRKYIVQ